MRHLHWLEQACSRPARPKRPLAVPRSWGGVGDVGSFGFMVCAWLYCTGARSQSSHLDDHGLRATTNRIFGEVAYW